MLLRRVALALVASAVACTADDGGDGSDDTTGAMDLEPPPSPVFLEPVSDRLEIPIDRTSDVRLGVAGILPGTTRLLVDGFNAGPLPASDPFATLDTSELTLRLRGGMVEGVHTMQLVNDGAEDPLSSRQIQVALLPVALPPIELAVGDPVIEGRAVAVAGLGDDPLLLVLDQLAPSAPLLHVVPAEDGRWAYDLARTIPIFGYQRAPSERGLAISATRSRHPDGTPDRLRVAWRVGHPGTAIALADSAWGYADLSTTSVHAIELDPEVLGPYEYAELGHPRLLSQSLVAEVYAATDVESARPGDHALLEAPLSGIPAQVGNVHRVVLGTRADLDHIGPVLDPAFAELGPADAIAARLDGARPVVLVADPDHGRLELRPGLGGDFGFAFVTAQGPLGTFIGAFGSRTVVAFDGDHEPPLAMVRIDDWGGGASKVLRMDRDMLPAGVSGEPALGLLDGVPIAVLPYDELDETWVVRPLDRDLVVERLDVPCRQVALASAPHIERGAAISMACVQGETVVDTTLRAVPAE